MQALEAEPTLSEAGERRAAVLFEERHRRIVERTDRLFAGLMVVEWLAAILAACWILPRSWAGQPGQIPVHGWSAVVLASAMVALPVLLALVRPGRTLTRHAIAVGQMLISSLLIHLTGGRIETHFLVFGSLAGLALYRDWRVLISASVIVAGDQGVRGIYWPQSVYGVLAPDPWRWLEHAGWLLFEDLFLITACLRSTREARETAVRQATQEALCRDVEQAIGERSAALTASEERFRSLSACVPIGIFQADHRGRCTYINAKLRAIAGLPSKSRAEDDWLTLVYEDDREAVLAAWSDTVRRGAEFVHEFRFRGRSNDVRWVDSRATPVVGEDGRLAYYVGTMEDITQRRLAEQAIRESEERFRKIFVESPVGMVIVASDLHFIDVNDGFCQMLGFARQGLSRLGLADVTHPDDVSDTIEQARMLFAREIPTLQVAKRFVTQDRRIIWGHLTASVIEGGRGKARLGLGVLQDFTERKNLEDQLRQSQKMEAVGRLAAGVAHDFNNLLTAIRGYSELIALRLADDDPTRRDLGEIGTVTEQAAALTRQLLAFSRQQVLRPKVLDLNAVVANMDRLLTRLIGEDIDLVAVRDPRLGRVKADPGQVEQVITNLVVNARDAMPRGGKLTIETANADVDEAHACRHPVMRPGPYVVLAVSDTGVGMDPQTQAHLFEPFFTTKEADGGMGLGLSTVYGIVKQSGGNVSVHSEAGRGTTFKVYLPRVEPPTETADTPESRVPPAGGSETILLAEDDEMVRQVAVQILRMEGYTVLTARTGEEAVQAAGEYAGRIHLLLTGALMPDMSGRVLAERVASQRPDMKVLYLSWSADDAAVHPGLHESSLRLLQKPFSRDALACRVREVLDERKGRPGERERPVSNRDSP